MMTISRILFAMFLAVALAGSAATLGTTPAQAGSKGHKSSNGNSSSLSGTDLGSGRKSNGNSNSLSGTDLGSSRKSGGASSGSAGTGSSSGSSKKR
jgi:hypothetical protein